MASPQGTAALPLAAVRTYLCGFAFVIVVIVVFCAAHSKDAYDRGHHLPTSVGASRAWNHQTHPKFAAERAHATHGTAAVKATKAYVGIFLQQLARDINAGDLRTVAAAEKSLHAFLAGKPKQAYKVSPEVLARFNDVVLSRRVEVR